jgi:ribonuclease-3
MHKLEERLGYRFGDPDLLQQALTHRSYANELGTGAPDNESLEFLGDAILSFLVGDELHRRYPEFREGRLTKVKAALVQSSNLAPLAQSLGIGEKLLLGRGERKTGGATKDSLLANAFEAVLAAVYRDGGIRAARAFVRRTMGRQIRTAAEGAAEIQDPKSALQERLQALGKPLPLYKVVEESGPDHRKTYVVELRVGRRALARGRGPSKKGAQREAARIALEGIRGW